MLCSKFCMSSLFTLLSIFVGQLQGLTMQNDCMNWYFQLQTHLGCFVSSMTVKKQTSKKVIVNRTRKEQIVVLTTMKRIREQLCEKEYMCYNEQEEMQQEGLSSSMLETVETTFFKFLIKWSLLQREQRDAEPSLNLR